MLRTFAIVPLLMASAGAAMASEPSNLREAAPGVYVGGSPDTDHDWDALRALGVRTVVGVDGAAPELAKAHDRSIRVVHIPIGYGAMGPDDFAQLALAAREVEKPIYVYCHHGNHRGPAAAAVICRAASLFDQKDATKLLRLAGTSPDYAGLWSSVVEFDPAAPVPATTRLVEISEVSPLKLAMGQLDQAHDEATAAPPQSEERRHALVVAHQALVESRRAAGLENRADAAELLARFDDALRRCDALAAAETVPSDDAAERFAASCVECHAHHRD